MCMWFWYNSLVDCLTFWGPITGGKRVKGSGGGCVSAFFRKHFEIFSLPEAVSTNLRVPYEIPNIIQSCLLS